MRVEPIKNSVRFLVGAGFLVEGADTIDPEKLTVAHLTKKGIMATEINEGDSILIAELYESGRLSSCTVAEVAAIMATFITERVNEINDDVPPQIREHYKWLKDFSAKIMDSDELISGGWAWPIYKLVS